MEAMLLTVAHQEKVIHILEQSALPRLLQETRKVSSQVFSEQGWGVFNLWGRQGQVSWI
jgi:hypothetical protein